MLNWVFGNKRKAASATKKKKKATGPKPSYERAREIADKGTVEERQKLAQHEDLEPEILYYFATDPAVEVRLEVAENVGTPLQADLILAKDPDEKVRRELATKIGRLVPELTEEENERLVDMAMEVIEILAQDELPRVRAIVAEELKLATNVPKKIIRNLADDLEEIVSVPVLEYSPLLSELDLLEIIEKGLKGERLLAVARRQDITEPVVDAVVADKDPEVATVVLDNETAAISEATFDLLVDIAEADEECRKSIVYRADLPVRVILRIAEFVNAALMETLLARNAHQKEAVDQIRRTVRKRIEKGELAGDDLPFETASERAEREFQEGKLDEDRLNKALDDHDNAYARYALQLLAGVKEETGSTILNSRSAKAVVALAWKANVSMKTAERLQDQVCRITSDKLLRAKPDGGYPLAKDDLEWYLDSFLSE